MALGRPPLSTAGAWNQEQTPSTAADGTTKDIDLVVRQAGVALTLVTTDTVIDGSIYLWEKSLLPYGRSVYLEVVASGVNVAAIVGVTAMLYTAAGVLVTGSPITVSSLTPARARTAALPLTDNTEYVVRYKTSGLAGTAYLYFARLVIR